MICPAVLWHVTIWLTACVAIAAAVANVMRACKSYRGGGTLWRLAIMQSAVCGYVAVLYALTACNYFGTMDGDARFLFRIAILLLTLSVLVEAILDI